MAKEYSELEQLVNDVTSLDTARMTLRWALERLNSIEKEKADLKKNLTIAEETSKRLQLKEASLTDAYSSRAKTLEEKEDFYTKLEATMSLLGEGKLDIQQLLKKEAKLDSLRHSLENEYQDKFDELDRNQRAVIERWNSRLLEVESQYSGRLAEAQEKYDGLRAGLEAEYQGRLGSLQASFKSREKELSARIGQLEDSVRLSEGKVETRRGELEAEYLSKKREAEEKYRKLSSMLDSGFEDKLRAMDSDHALQVRSLEGSWQIERARLMEEQRVRDDQFNSAQARIKEVENKLALQQETHHNELLKIITEKETAFRAQLVGLEQEKTAKEAAVKELVSKLEKKTAGWEAERARLEAEFGRRLEGIDATARARAGELEQEYASKKEELKSVLALSRAEFEAEFKARLAMERQALAEEKSRLAEEKRLREEALARNTEKVKELENALAAGHEEHHKELMERIRSGEASFREKLSAFEAEKQAYNKTIGDLTADIRRKEADVLDEKKKIAAEYEAKAAIHGELLARTEAAFEEKRRVYEEKIAALALRLEEAAKNSAFETENFKSEIARISAGTNALADERAAGIRADYEARKVELEQEFAARYGDRMKALEAEKARMNEALAEREGQLETAYAKAAELDGSIAELRRSASEEKAALSREYSEEMKGALKAAEESAKAREAELFTDINVLREELTEKDRQLSAEREKLVDELSKASVDAHNRTEERAAAVRAEYEVRLAAQAEQAGNAMSGLKAALAGKEAQLEKASADRAEAERAIKAVFDAEKAKWQGEKETLTAGFERSIAEFDASLAERVAVVRADYEARKVELEQEFAARYGDRMKALEAEKARMNEALAEREGQLETAYAKAAELDGSIAELRRSASEEKAALSREYSEEMKGALKAAEESAKAREAELFTDINVLREELTEKDRQLSAEREKLVDELSKASVDAHNRTEERAAAVRAEYEVRLAAQAEQAGNAMSGLKAALAGKEAQLEKASADRAEAERDLRADFERRVLELDAQVSARVSALEAEHAARRDKLEAEAAGRAEALNAEAAVRMESERGNWQAERRRFERALEETSGNFRAAQKEIEGLSLGLRQAAAANAAREAVFNRELMEAKSTYDQELAYRVKDAVAVQTAHLMEALGTAKTRQEELAAGLEEKENSIRALRAEALETSRNYEERLGTAGSDAVLARRKELEQLYASRREELEKDSAALREELDNAYQSKEKEMLRRIGYKEAQLEAEKGDLAAGMEKLRAQAEAATAKAAEVFAKMMRAAKEHQEELFRLKEEHADEFENKLSAAVEAATRAMAGKTTLAEGGLAKAREDHKKEIAALEKFFGETREKMAAELESSRNYAEVLDFKIQDMEKELAKSRQNSAAEFLGRMTEQDEHVASLEKKYKARQEKLESEAGQRIMEIASSYESKMKDLEATLKAKEQLIQDSEEFWGKKQAEVDKSHAEFNLRINKFHEELFSQKQAMNEKEKGLNEFRLKLEREYQAKCAETENMKSELSRAIIDYKNRK